MAVTGSTDDALHVALHDRVGGEHAAAADAFAAAYVRRHAAVDGDGDVAADPQLGAEIAGAFELAAARGGAPSAVRALTPEDGRDGYATGGSVVETNTHDLPFLVDTVGSLLRARGHAVRRVVHPIVGVRRDERGAITEIVHPREGTRESVMHFELDRRLDPAELAAIEDAVRDALADVARVVADEAPMRERVRAMVELARGAGARYDTEEIEEAIAFLDWIADDHFVLLGAREYELTADEVWRVEAGSGLGLLADEEQSTYTSGVPLSAVPETLRHRALEGDLLVVAQTNATSPVRRADRMTYVGVRVIDGNGRPVGESRLLGLASSRAETQTASTIPLLRRKLERIVSAEDLVEGSHDFKAAVRLFDGFPKAELFVASIADLRAAIVALLDLTGDEVRLLGRRSADGRTVHLIAALSRRRYDANLRRALRTLVERRYGVRAIEAVEVIGHDDRVQYHLTVHNAETELPEVDVEALEQLLVAMSRTWEDAVLEALERVHGAERGAILGARWLHRLPRAYREITAAKLAAGDIGRLEALHGARADFGVGLATDGKRTRVTLFKHGAKVELTEATRLLEDLGLRVIEEVPTRLDGDDEAWLQAFGVLGPHDEPLDLDACGERVAACLEAAWAGEVESDALHRLVVLAELDHRQVEVLRAFRRYRQRLGSRYTESYQNDVLAANAQLCARQMAYFAARFDPSRAVDEEAEQAMRSELVSALDDVELLDHDRILRNQLGLIDATVRTTAFKRGREIAFKVRSGEVPAMPTPAPLLEIYVYAPDFEGVHLRGGMIARGGIRSSDRMDYRTEVFGLMRAQMTKNAVIVPTGAKGGFFLREGAGDPARVRDAYRRYVEALLDLTDDLRDGEVVHPEGLRVRDGDDTYLVVAADKGTATFSDTANAIAERRGFWLGDAFASGGSTGYDHKALGITARGAWESVKRHFRALGLDPSTDDFTAVGIGDMSGDVFGNGMLLSEHIKLVGAYDHRHVFCDPDPDPAVAHAERARLFGLERSSWDDYDREQISAGGGVWPRTAKSIPLSDEMREALRTDARELAPTELIRAILRAPVDLLFNGGIGTVVKASDESDADARDRSSDAIRVDAPELRCRVVGEGGNLGLTHQARIEAARHGVLINADFIDNSAGVDCSDHEVNLKVLLRLAETKGHLERPDRDRLLRDCSEDVTRHVLHDSFEQAQLLAREVRASAIQLWAYEDLMLALEDAGLLQRDVEALPSTSAVADRRRAGEGLQLPELAVLVAYAKRHLAAELLRDRGLLDDPSLVEDLRAYFPDPVVERFGDLLDEHPLRAQLLATIAANDVVNRLGPTFVSRLVAERGASVVEVVRAYRVASAATRAPARWGAIEALDGAITPDVHAELAAGVDALVEGLARWVLAHDPHRGTVEESAAALRGGFDELWRVLPTLRSDEWRRHAEDAADGLVARGVPESLARAHAMQSALVHAPDVIAAAHTTRRSVSDVARAFFALGDALALDWLEVQLGKLPAGGRLQRWAVFALADDVLAVRRQLAEVALTEAPAEQPQAAVDTFVQARTPQRERLRAFTRGLSSEGEADLAALTLVLRQLRALA